MASNLTLNPTTNHHWFNGFGNIFSEVNHKWWGTKHWLIQTLIWMVIINGMLAMIVLPKPKFDPSQPPPSEAELAEMKAGVADTGIGLFIVFAGMFGACGAVVLAQDALIGEKRSGTAAWVLSKPVSRTAFFLAKLTADAIGILVTMVIVQGVISYFILRAGTGISFPITNYLAAIGLLGLTLLFFLSLTYMLGALSNVRGLVVGLPLVVIFVSQFANKFPLLVRVMPWNIVTDMIGPAGISPALAGALIKGEPLAMITPIIGTAVLTVLMIIVAAWRFQREEF